MPLGPGAWSWRTVNVRRRRPSPRRTGSAGAASGLPLDGAREALPVNFTRPQCPSCSAAAHVHHWSTALQHASVRASRLTQRMHGREDGSVEADCCSPCGPLVPAFAVCNQPGHHELWHRLGAIFWQRAQRVPYVYRNATVGLHRPSSQAGCRERT